MIPQSFIQDLLNRIDIVDVVGRYVQLKKGGANLMGLCPFHNEKSPSFTVSPSKQFYHCFGCGANGSAISFLMEYSGLGFVEAVKDLAQGIGVTVPDERDDNAPRRDGPNFAVLAGLMDSASRFYRDQLKTSELAKQYLKGRGLTGEIARDYGLGYSPDEWNALQSVYGEKYESEAFLQTGLAIVGEKGRRYDRFRGRVMFPIRNTRGVIIGFGGRVIGDGEPKYLNSPETPLFEKGLELYGLHEARKAIREAKRVLVVEGYMDVVALAQHGVGYAVATLGTACTAAHVQKLTKQADLIIFCFDGDAAGRRAAWRALENCLSLTNDETVFRFLFLPAEHDPDSFIRQHGREAFQAEESRARPLSVFLLDHLKAETDLNTAEGRASFINMAKPLLQRITGPALRLNLLKDVASLTDLTPNEVERLCDLKPQASAQKPRIPRKPPAQIEAHLLRSLVRLPRLARDPVVEDARHVIAEDSITRRVIEVIEANDGIDSSAKLLEYFRDTDDEEIIKEASRHGLDVENEDRKEDEMVEMEFVKALARPEIVWIDARMVALVDLIRGGQGTPEVKQEYRELQTRRQALQIRLKGDAETT